MLAFLSSRQFPAKIHLVTHHGESSSLVRPALLLSVLGHKRLSFCTRKLDPLVRAFMLARIIMSVWKSTLSSIIICGYRDRCA
jgi:hypothetical protein